MQDFMSLFDELGPPNANTLDVAQFGSFGSFDLHGSQEPEVFRGFGTQTLQVSGGHFVAKQHFLTFLGCLSSI